MRYTRTAITQLSRWYKSVLIKCAIFNAAMFLGSVGFSGNVSAVETPVSNWDELKSNVVAGNSVIFNGNITTSGVDAIYSKNTVPGAINLNSNVLDAQVNQGYESYGIPHNSVFYFEGSAEGAKTSITGGTIQNAINSTLYWEVYGSELEIADMNFLNNYVTGQYSNRYGQGGALKLSGANKVTISDSVFTGNTVHDASNQSYGGAIESYVDNLVISDSTFNYNGIKDYDSAPQTTTQDGGAMMIASENSTLDNVTLTSNKSTDSGGAIAYIPVYDIKSTIKNSSFEGNETVNNGGAIYAERSEITDLANIGLTVENTNFTSNKATGANSKGGAIYASSDVNGLTITDSSFRNNAAKEGGAIYSESSSTTTIQANSKDVVFENNNSTGTAGGTGSGIYLTGSLNAMASEGKTLTINDTIKFAGSNSMLNINTDFTNNYAGTVVLDKALDGGYGINLGGGATGDAGTLKLGQEAANQTLNFLGAYGAALDLRNDHAGDVLTINELSANRVSTTNLNLDFDASSGVSDKLVINSLESGVDSAKFNLNAINVTADGTASSGTFMESAVSDDITLSQTPQLTTVTSGGYKYTFTLDDNNFGVFNVIRGTSIEASSLAEAIGLSVIDAYSMLSQETVTQTLGTLAGDNREFTIYGNTNDIIASGSVEGIGIYEGQTLTIDKVGDINDSTSKGFSGFSAGYAGAIFNWSDGTLNISDSVFSDNRHYLYSAAAVVYNIGEANITNSIFRDNGTAVTNVAEISSDMSSLNHLGVVNVTDTDFINNESDYGAIINVGTMSIVAQDKDVLFSGNNSTNAGGAIYNTKGNWSFAGLGVLNLNAKNGHKITFSAATDTANNDIYNVATLNLNEGNIEILSAITDAAAPAGTTNIGTATTTATVVANAITQKALNINNGSSLAIDADGLKIADTINNLGSIALGDGTLTSAIGGTDGTTVINGDVVANSAIAQAITVNTDKSLTASADNIGGAIANSGTVNLNSGTLAQTITGGNIYILASQEVTSDLSKLAGNLVNSGTLNLQGELIKDIQGSGTTVLQKDITLAEDRTIAGTLDINNKNINMQDSATSYTTLSVNNLAGTANLQIDSSLSDGQTDKIVTSADSVSGAILNLTSVNVTSDGGNTGENSNILTYLSGNTNNIQFQLNGAADGSLTTYTGNYEYVFSLGDAGQLDVTRTASTAGLSNFINGTNGVTGNTFSLTEDVSVTQDGDIGTVDRTNDSTTLNLNINEHTLTGKGTNSFDGITVADGYTLNVNGKDVASQGTITNFDTAFTNDGTLNISNINFENNNEDIINAGTLNLSGKNSVNTIVGDGDMQVVSGTTTNNGTIEQNSISIASGATLNTDASDLIASAGVVNSGTLELTGGVVQSNITGNGTLSILDNITNDKTITQAINIANDKTLTNNGTLNTSVQLTANQTIDGNGTLNLTGTSINEGSITQGVVNVADTAELTTAADTITANINNAGNLKLTGGVNSNTISGAGTTEIAGIVENTGTISQAIKIDSGSLTTLASGLGGTVTNAIDGGLVLNGGTLTQTVSGDGSTTIAGDVTANALISQAITVNADNSLTIGANNIGGAIANEGTLNLNSGTLNQTVSGSGSTTIAGDVLWGENAGLGNTSIAQNGSLDIGTNEVTLGDTTINGTLKMTITDMAKDSSDYTGGKLIVNDLDLGESSKLSMTVASGLITERDASTGGLDLITVTGASSGKFAEMLSNNRYAVTTDDNGKFKITYTASPTDIVNEGGGNINNAQAAEAWDKVPTTGNAATDDMQAHLNELSQHDSNGYVKALNNLAPTDSRAVARTTVDVNNLIGHQIERRQDMQGLNSGDTFQNVGAWMEGLYNYSKQDSSSTHAGFTGKTAGFALGMDGKVNEDTMIGFGYANNQTDIDSLDRDIDVDGHTLFVYGKYQPAKWYVRGMAHYGFASYDEKSNVNGKHNSADYDVQNIGVSAYAGYDLPNGITPEAGLRFTHITQDDYTDYVGQHISVDDNDILTLVAGAKYSKTFTGEDGIHWTPKARAAVTYDVIKDDNNANVDIAGINYDVTGEKINRLEFEVGLGIEADVNNWNFSVGYDAGIREDYISHTGMFRARYNF